MKEYHTVDTSLEFDSKDRIKRNTYLHIDNKALVNNGPRELIEIILSDQYL
jgi:hypothetical protein